MKKLTMLIISLFVEHVKPAVMVILKEISYNTPQYEQMVALRYRILREPLGLTFLEKELERDRYDILLAAFLPGEEQMAGCCVLTSLSESVIQLRQMAVDSFSQRQGLGSKLLSFAEKTAAERNCRSLYLHARREAVGFYEKNGYIVEGDPFDEVGIPHFEMMKVIRAGLK